MTTVAAFGERLCTSAAYLETEEAASGKHEFYKGKIIEVAGATYEYNVISGNVITELNIAIEPQNSILQYVPAI